MIRIAVAEDDSKCAKQLCGYIRDYEKESGYSFSVETFTDGDQLVEGYRAQFDIILMDVQMPLMDGMEAAAEIRKVDHEVVIIFITNMAQYAIRGYEVDALDYVLKPVSYFAFSQRLGRALQRIRNREKTYFAVPVKGGVVKMAASDLFYVESQGHQIIYHARTGIRVSSGTIQEMQEKLEPQGFFRCNKGYLVNLKYVDAVRDGCAVVNGESLLISRAKRNSFLEALTDYIGEVSL